MQLLKYLNLCYFRFKPFLDIPPKTLFSTTVHLWPDEIDRNVNFNISLLRESILKIFMAN